MNNRRGDHVLPVVVLLAMAFASISSANAVSASTSPFPPVITTHLWNPKPGTMGPKVAFGAYAALRKPGSRLCENLAVAGVEWTVWCDQTAQFPVVSTDGGRRWKVAGPLLANDWVGGSEYYVTKVTAFSPAVVLLVGSGVIDTTFDGGHTWRQLSTSLSMAGAWKMSIVRFEGGTGVKPYEPVMHVVEHHTVNPPETWSATYISSDRGHTWDRMSELGP